MDTFARGLKAAALIFKDGVMNKHVEERYQSFRSGIGAKIESGETSLEELEAYALSQGEPERISGQQEHYENMLNFYV
ncbi:xylose isomerase [Elysia marginata]|uniref:Xylose isomerase n=1 Tax=Elysia marginata TaxID=1093978 RepID=A0AAV4HIS7_9GAST|nr:xylose isomerase [Elysia marginata]